MADDNTHHMPSQRCACGHELDAASPVDQNHVEPPGPGDMTICIACGTFLQFEAGGRLRMMTDDDIDKLPNEVREQVRRVRQGYAVFRAQRGYP